MLKRSDGRPTLQTKEGVTAVKEAIAVLKNTKPINELTWANGIMNACKDHAQDIG